jgi:flagellar basal-body rod modification protein FlgD
VDAIDTLSLTGTSTNVAASDSLGALGADAFLELLITQLQKQDPFEPMDNAQLLEQISSIRDIEQTTALTGALTALTAQQSMVSVSSFIGQYVTGFVEGSGVVEGALVVGVRFANGGQPVLQLSNGGEMTLDRVSTIQSPLEAAQALMGQTVLGLDRRDPDDPKVVDGLVAGVRTDSAGDVLLELDTGDDLRLRDFVRIASTDVT